GRHLCRRGTAGRRAREGAAAARGRGGARRCAGDVRRAGARGAGAPAAGLLRRARADDERDHRPSGRGLVSWRPSDARTVGPDRGEAAHPHPARRRGPFGQRRGSAGHPQQRRAGLRGRPPTTHLPRRRRSPSPPEESGQGLRPERQLRGGPARLRGDDDDGRARPGRGQTDRVLGPPAPGEPGATRAACPAVPSAIASPRACRRSAVRRHAYAVSVHIAGGRPASCAGHRGRGQPRPGRRRQAAVL
ncbi:unnamed protein product, partial [Prorocentrum cordatum]